MTWTTWVALAAALALTLLPTGPVVRAGDLAGSGRLGAGVTGAVGSVAGVGLAARLRSRRGARGALAAASAVLLVAVGAVGLAAGPLLAVAAAALLGTALVLGRDLLRGRASAAEHRAVLTAVRVLVGELEAGAHPPAALAGAAAGAAGIEGPGAAGSGVADAFAGAAEVAARGGDAGAVLAAAEPVALRTIGTAWLLGESVGAAGADVLGRVLADLEAADDQRRAVDVTLAGPRSSAAVLSGLPLVGIALGAAMGARPLALLTGDPAGRALCCAGVLLDVAGILWMRSIVGRARRP